MRHLTLSEVLYLHERIVARGGGEEGVRDLSRVRAVVAQARDTIADGSPKTLTEQAAALCFDLVQAQAFVDGNTRVGHAAMEVLLLLNGVHLEADVDEQARVLLAVSASDITRKQLCEWIDAHSSTKAERPHS